MRSLKYIIILFLLLSGCSQEVIKKVKVVESRARILNDNNPKDSRRQYQLLWVVTFEDGTGGEAWYDCTIDEYDKFELGE